MMTAFRAQENGNIYARLNFAASAMPVSGAPAKSCYCWCIYIPSHHETFSYILLKGGCNLLIRATPKANFWGEVCRGDYYSTKSLPGAHGPPMSLFISFHYRSKASTCGFSKWRPVKWTPLKSHYGRYHSTISNFPPNPSLQLVPAKRHVKATAMTSPAPRTM